MPEPLQWYSSKLRTVCLVEASGPLHYMDCVHVFRATSWQSALERAVELGRAHERSYLNDDNRKVRWALKEILTLDVLSDFQLDGAEVHSEFSDVAADDSSELDTIFHPEDSSPEQSV